MACCGFTAQPKPGLCLKKLMQLTLTFLLGCLGFSCFAQSTINLPERAADAVTASEFVQQITAEDFAGREQRIFSEINAGNIPDFLRQFQPVTVTNISGGQTNVATFYVAPDYLAVGTDADYFRTPMTPMTAQRIADRLGCILPTRKMVDAIYAAAPLKLAPAPMSPGPAMTTVSVFAQHNAMVQTQRAMFLQSHPLGSLVAGHQKDLVITPLLAVAPGKVAIYGWHQTNGMPIQPLYVKHAATWVDYSQCVRLVQEAMTVNGQPTTVSAVLANSKLAGLLSDEGVITNPRYPTNEIISAEAGGSFQPSGHFGEFISRFTISPEVNVLVNAPAPTHIAPDKPVLLIFYALPNGNSIDQTIGHTPRPGEDWHFDIQHIGAQTRWLRSVLTNHTVVIAYLEAAGKSWPVWRKKNGDAGITNILERVEHLFPTNRVEIALTSHSGGGSLIFGWLNMLTEIPDNVVRIAFLDSDYGYQAASGHVTKLAHWINASDRHALCVLAYDDAAALLEGKPFVSADGGTWGRSHAMLKDLSQQFHFTSQTNNGLENYSALGGRIEFLLKENPDRKIFHTVQVERNGFIQAMLSGTTNESRGYEYFGERAYGDKISPK
jgi:hypothetical protein